MTVGLSAPTSQWDEVGSNPAGRITQQDRTMKLQHEIEAFIENYGPPPYSGGTASPFDTLGRNWAVEIVDRGRAAGLSPKDICRKLGLHPVTVESWRRKAHKKAAEVSIADKHQQDLTLDLEKRIDEFIKKYGPLRFKRGGNFQYPESARVAALDIVDCGLTRGQSQAEISVKLGLGKSTIYQWRGMVEQKKVKEREAKPPSSEGRVRMEDTTELPDVSKYVAEAGEVTFELPGGGVVIGTPKDVAEFANLIARPTGQ